MGSRWNLAKSQLGPYHLRLSISLPLPTSSHHLSLDIISHNKVSTLLLSFSSSSPAAWNALVDAEADSSFLPTPGHTAALVSTYITSIYFLLMFYYVFHAPSPPHHEFFHLHHGESSSCSINRCWHHSCWGPISPKVSTQVSFSYDSWICFAHFLCHPTCPHHHPPTCLPHQLPQPLFYCFDGMRWVGILLFWFVLLSSRYSCCLAVYLVIYFMVLVLICVCEPIRASGNGMATLGVN